MGPMKRAAAVIILAAIAALPGLSAGRKAPGFALPDSTGRTVFLSSLKQNLVISFWASYCKPCKTEMPLLVGLEKKYAGTKNLKLLLVNIDVNDEGGEAKDKARRFLKSAGVEHEYLLDFFHTAVSKFNPQKRIPATFLVNRQGIILFEEIGYRAGAIEALDKAIAQLR
jgi:thiol-disulfide isomerase/thioredoxin